MSEDFQYTPSIPPGDIDDDLHDWIAREFQNIHSALYQKLGMYGRDGAWYDALTSLNSGKVPAANAPTWTAFGPTGTNFAYVFGLNDYIQTDGFHVNHDVKRGSLMYPHVHWTTDGTDVNTVKWEISYTTAKGHNQEAFPADTVITVEEAASGTAWQHMVTEVVAGDAIVMPEVDSIVMIRVRRITNGGTDNTDAVFGLYVDMHYQRERLGTPGKAPDFYKGT